MSVYRYPARIAVLYLAATVLMYFCGAYVWYVPDPVKLVAFLAVAYSAFWFGARFTRRDMLGRRRLRLLRLAIDGVTLFRVSAAFSVVAYVVMANYYGRGLILDNLLLSLGEVYVGKASRMVYERNTAVQVLSWLWGFTYLYLPLGLQLYRRMTRADRMLLVVTTTTCIWYWLSIGTMKGIGDVGIQVFVFIAILRSRARLAALRGDDGARVMPSTPRTASPPSRRRHKRYIVVGLAVALLFLYAFDTVQTRRDIALYGAERSASYVPSMLASHVVAVRDTPLPHAVETLMFYMSHGYTGLAYSLELPFEWTGMVGFSRSLTELAKGHLPVEVSEITYMQRVEDVYGWPNGMVWSTVFPWIAGDVTFFGVPLVMLVLGRLFTRTWSACLDDSPRFNILDVVMFNQLAILVLYLPANNQVVQSRQALFAVMLLSVIRVFLAVRNVSLPPLRRSENV